MRSFRSKPVGWRGESYRHYLASKGIASKMPKEKYFFQKRIDWVRDWAREIAYVRAGIKTLATVDISFEEEDELKNSLGDDLIAVESLPERRSVDGFIEYHVTKKENKDEAISASDETRKGVQRIEAEEDYGDEEYAEKVRALGKKYGYPDGAIEEWLERSIKNQDVEDLDEVYYDMRYGYIKALEVGIPKEDLDLLEFIPGSDVEETKREIAKRKKVLGIEGEE